MPAKRPPRPAPAPGDVGKTYTVCDGDLVLTLEIAEEGGYLVTSPLDPEMMTQAESIPEAFYMARDALQLIHECRKDLYAELHRLRAS